MTWLKAIWIERSSEALSIEGKKWAAGVFLIISQALIRPCSRQVSCDEKGAEEAKEASTGREESKEMSAADDSAAEKQFAGFLSHYKFEFGTEARLVQRELRDILPPGCNTLFLDSDDLNDLRLLLQHVKDTEVLVLLQSKGVLTVGFVHTNTYSESNSQTH